jgi:hypothetical protein
VVAARGPCTSPLADGSGVTQNRAELMRLGREGLTEVWRCLGIQALLDDDTFYLEVSDPKVWV